MTEQPENHHPNVEENIHQGRKSTIIHRWKASHQKYVRDSSIIQKVGWWVLDNLVQMQRYSIKSNNLQIFFDLCVEEQLFFYLYFLFISFLLGFTVRFRKFSSLASNQRYAFIWSHFYSVDFHHLQIFYSSWDIL